MLISRSKALLSRASLRGLSTGTGLPHVPLPSVEETAQRYIKSLSPLLFKSPVELEETKGIVENFVNHESTKRLQAGLEELDRTDGSYIKGFWDDMYLNGRWALPINSNPFLLFNPFKRQGMISIASALTVSSLKFALKVQEGKLEPSFVKNLPLCMSQYPKMFGTTRIPEPKRDRLFTDSKSKHIVVLVNGDFYAIDVITKDGKIRSEENLGSLFEEMIARTKSDHISDKGLGVFTTTDRDSWAKIRSDLEKDPVNKKSLDLIDSAIFTVCLDAHEGSGGLQEVSESLLHGSLKGDEVPLNRWFDKSVSLIVDGQGNSGVNFEHTWGDGVPVARFMHEVFSDLNGEKSGYAPLHAPTDSGELPSRFQLLKWNLSSSSREALQKAKEEYSEAISNVETDVLQLDNIGTADFKKAGLSPDGVIQMAIQLAYFQLYHRIVSTYESCNVQHFHLGRTETIRSASADALTLVQRFDKTNNEEAFELLKRATKTHIKIAEDARNGRGVDRHLYALNCMSQKLGQQTPDIFRDPAYLKFTSNILSTSTLSAPFAKLAGFGAVNPGGYGIAYIANENSLTFNLTSFKNHPGSNSADFGQKLKEAFQKFALCFPNGHKK